MSIILINFLKIFSVVLSFCGIGKFFFNLSNLPQKNLISLNIILGLSIYIFFFGILDLFETSYKIFFYFIYFLGLFFLFIKKNYLFLIKYFSFVFILAYIVIFIFFFIFYNISINFEDDAKAYLIPIKNIIDNNFKGNNTFNFRLTISPFYSYSYFYSLFYYLGISYENFKIIDLGFGLFLLTFLTIDIFFYRKCLNNKLFFISFVIILLGLLNTPIYANITPLILGGGLVLGLIFYIETLINNKNILYIQIFYLSLIFVFLISLKNNYIISSLLIIFLFSFLIFFQKEKFTLSIKKISFFFFFILIFLSPWLISAYIRTESIFYPFITKQTLVASSINTFNDLIAFNFWIRSFTPYIMISIFCMILFFLNKKISNNYKYFFLTILIVQIILIFFSTRFLMVEFRHVHSIVLIPTTYLLFQVFFFDFKLLNLSKLHKVILIFFSVSIFLFSFLNIKKNIQILALELKDNVNIFFNYKNKNLILFPLEAKKEYEEIQIAIPNQKKILVMVDFPTILDFKRNTIFVADLFGMAGFGVIENIKNYNDLRSYLQGKNIDFIIYSYNSKSINSLWESTNSQINLLGSTHFKFINLLNDAIVEQSVILKTKNNAIIDLSKK
jgi:hypothetical protein